MFVDIAEDNNLYVVIDNIGFAPFVYTCLLLTFFEFIYSFIRLF